tara:strand:+ start:34 stop:693 length:660 start_codon:yes stop_codon:yes gene_type:complete
MDLFPVIETDLIEETPAELPEESDEPEPEPEPKEIVKQEDIFVEKPKPIIKEIIEDDIDSEDEVVPETPKPKPKPVKEKKPRKPMSEAQKECLRIGREKALAVRRANAKDKKELKELHTKKKQKELKQLKEFVNDDFDPPMQSNNPQMPSLTEDQIEERTQKAVSNALKQHEEARQKRKVVKKQKQADDKLKDMCINASLYQKPPAKFGDDNFFDVCFQ